MATETQVIMSDLATAHHMPCVIDHTGSAAVSSFFLTENTGVVRMMRGVLLSTSAGAEHQQ